MLVPSCCREMPADYDKEEEMDEMALEALFEDVFFIGSLIFIILFILIFFILLSRPSSKTSCSWVRRVRVG